jgi:hypothetical protein
LIAAALLLTSPSAACAQGAARLFSIASQGDNPHLLREIDPNTAVTIGSVVINYPAGTVLGGTGLATNPVTGELYALLRIMGQTGRELVTIDPDTGATVDIGNTGAQFASLAFDATGTLYGVTGEGGAAPETLFTISTTDATSSPVLPLGNGGDGEALGFNPVDGFLYHASGHTGADVFFERINLSTLAVTNIPVGGTALTDEETQALTFWPSRGVFLWKQNHGIGPLFAVTADGVPTLIGDLDHQSKGLAFVGGTGVPASVNGAGTYRDGRSAGTVRVQTSSLRGRATGRVEFSDARARIRFVSTQITGVTVNGNIATITGLGAIGGGAPQPFTLTVTDGAGSRRNPDLVSINVGGQGGFSRTVTLIGNIRIQTANPQ